MASRRLRSVAQFSVSVAKNPRYCQSTGTFHGCSGSDPPTIASTDAPCSALSVIYTDRVSLTAICCCQITRIWSLSTQNRRWRTCTSVSGGYRRCAATWFEARACSRSGATTMAGGSAPRLRWHWLNCATTPCWKKRKSDACCRTACSDSGAGARVEANTYLSGVGFESGGLAAATQCITA